MIFDFDGVDEIFEYRGMTVQMECCTWIPEEQIDYVGFSVDGRFREIPARDMHDIIAHLDKILDGPKASEVKK